VGHLLARAAVAVVTLIVVLGVVRGQSLWDMVIFGIALAVAVVPEAFPPWSPSRWPSAPNEW